MKKFIITGLKRSGTTFLSSLLNTNENITCVEYKLMDLKAIDNSLKLNRYNSITSANFSHYQIKPPLVNKIGFKKKDLIDNFLREINDFYKTEIIGFKQTLLSYKQIEEGISYGFKIIIINRNLENIFNSYMNRFNVSKFQVAVEIKDYLKDINFYKFNKKFKKKILILNFDELYNDKEKLEKKISDFLEVKIKYHDKVFYSFNKNIKYNEKNTSFFVKNEISDSDKIYLDFILGKFNTISIKYQLIKILRFFNKFLVKKFIN